MQLEQNIHNNKPFDGESKIDMELINNPSKWIVPVGLKPGDKVNKSDYGAMQIGCMKRCMESPEFIGKFLPRYLHKGKIMVDPNLETYVAEVWAENFAGPYREYMDHWIKTWEAEHNN